MKLFEPNEALPDQDCFENDKQITLRGFLEPKLIKEQFAKALKALGIPKDRIRVKATGPNRSEPQNIGKQGNCMWYNEELPASTIRELTKYASTPDRDENIYVMKEPEEQLYITIKIPIEVEIQW